MTEAITCSNAILKAPTKYYSAYLHTKTDDSDLTYFAIYHLAVVRKAIEELHEYLQQKAKQQSDIQEQLRHASDYNPRQKEVTAKNPNDLQIVCRRRRKERLLQRGVRFLL